MNILPGYRVFLQQGKPDNDVLLYYTIADRYSEPGNVLLQHFDGMERNFERTPFEEVANQMLKQGYSFDFFSDRQLQHFNAVIVTGPNNPELNGFHPDASNKPFFTFSFFFAGLLAFLIGLSYAELSSIFSKSAAEYL